MPGHKDFKTLFQEKSKETLTESDILPSQEIKKYSVDELLKIYRTSLDGLSEEEVQGRIKIFGPNKIVEKKLNPFLKFLSYFWAPIPLMIFIAAILALLIKDYTEFWFILTLLILNGVIGFVEENTAENAIEELKKKLSLRSTVKRDGKIKEIDSTNLVPGDIVKLQIGQIVPGDGVLISNSPLEVDESSLTGESIGKKKEKGDVLYSSSIVKRGEGFMLITATGEKTYFGKTAKLVEDIKGTSNYQKQLIRIGSYLIKISIFLILIVIIFNSFIRHDNAIELTKFALVLMVASIPAALPTVLSLNMTISAKRLVKEKIIVKKLIALEELAGVDVLLCDKTGTLTKNKLDIIDIVTTQQHTKEDILFYSALCSDLESEDPIDSLIAKKIDDNIKKRLKYAEVLNFIPFDPTIKMSKAKIKLNGVIFEVAKGAPQKIAELAKEDSYFILQQNEKFSEKGYRVLPVAIKYDSWKLAGIIVMFDPPREDARKMIKYAKDMGIRVKLVSGDNNAIVKTTAKLLGIGSNISNFREFIENKDIKTLQKLIEYLDGFAEVFPEEKYNIVKLHQKSGHNVAMTGDGVNDAPALKAANVGISVANATDAAKSAASLVMSKNGIDVIIKAIKESRKMFNRMKTYVTYRIAETIRLVFFITCSILFLNFYPLTPTMILLLAFLNDLAILSIATDNVKIGNKPEKWELNKILLISTILGISGTISSFILYYIAYSFHIPKEMLQTIMFLKLTIAGHLTLFVSRTKGPFYELPPSKIVLFSSLSTIFIAILFSIFGIFLTPIPITTVLAIIIYSLAWFFLNDFLKQLALRTIEE